MSATTTQDGCCIENILENDLVSREIFAHLSLRDLLNISSVNPTWLNIVRCYIRENLISNRTLPKEPPPCTSLLSLETELESMTIPHYTGIRIYLKPCHTHFATDFPCDDTDDSYLEAMFPNILNRLNLKHIWLWFGSIEISQACNLTVKLIQKLCQKYAADSLRKITLKVNSSLAGVLPQNDPALLRKIFLNQDAKEPAVVDLKNLKILSVHCEWFREEMIEILLEFVQIFPKLEQVNCTRLNMVPDAWNKLVNKMILNGERSKWKWWQVDHFQGKYKLEYLRVLNCNFEQHYLPGLDPAAKIFEKLLWSGAESLRILSIRGSEDKEFPRWSTKQDQMPVLVSVEKLEVVTSFDSPLFLQEFGFICGVVCPGLKVVSIVHHSSCKVGPVIEPYDGQGQTIPNGTVRTLRLEGLNGERPVMMGEFKNRFPNLTELHLVDCDGSAIPQIFKWKTLECIVFGRRNLYWTENYDRFMLGVESEEEMLKLKRSWRSGHDLEKLAQTKPGLFSLAGLRRIYIMGGASPAGNSDENQQAFLSGEVMSLVAKKMPQLAIRILKGYQDSLLTHLLEFDNGAQNPWCPPLPHDVEQYFHYSM